MADNSDPVTIESPTHSAAEPPDSELVTLVCEGDESAFEKLFNRHRRRVAMIAGRFFRRPEEIEEIVQESFVKAYFALANFSNREDASFTSWIARIAFNSCYDELRRVKRRPESSISVVSEEEAALLKQKLCAADDIESAAVSRDLAVKLLSRLNPEDRLVLVMLDVEGLSVSEIAKSTKWSVSKVKVRVYRARALMRRVLKRFL